MNYNPGMLLSFKWDEKYFGVCKVVAITKTAKEPVINIITYSNSFETAPESVNAAELKPLVLHMPMSLASLQASECAAIGHTEVSVEEQAGFKKWLQAWQVNRSGYFEKPIGSAVEHIIEASACIDNGAPDSVFKERLRQRWQTETP